MLPGRVTRLHYLAWMIAALFLFQGKLLWAHEPDKSFLNLSLSNRHLEVQWDLPLQRLLTNAVASLNPDDTLSYEWLQKKNPELCRYAFKGLDAWLDDKPAHWIPSPDPGVVVEYAEGSFLRLQFSADFEGPTNIPASGLKLRYQLYFAVNSLHRGMMQLEHGGIERSAIFSLENQVQTFVLSDQNALTGFGGYLREGILHIASGADHILFLLSLLLPAVLMRDAGGWKPATSFRVALINTLKIVTAFTVAHSITFGLAAAQIISLPTRLTESAIAVSVALAAVNNLRVFLPGRGWQVAMVFGLVHGFGFANALAELGLKRERLLITLAGFNLGVETGQLAIVALFLPLAFALRKKNFYTTLILRMGSVVITLVALTWLAERVLDFKFLPF